MNISVFSRSLRYTSLSMRVFHVLYNCYIKDTALEPQKWCCMYSGHKQEQTFHLNNNYGTTMGSSHVRFTLQTHGQNGQYQ